MRHVILPFSRPAIIAALFITMAVSFDKFAVAWFVSGLNETLPVKVLGFLQGQVSRASTRSARSSSWPR
jgi:spermidine/putrescine transport system permease protein